MSVAPYPGGSYILHGQYVDSVVEEFLPLIVSVDSYLEALAIFRTTTLPACLFSCFIGSRSQLINEPYILYHVSKILCQCASTFLPKNSATLCRTRGTLYAVRRARAHRADVTHVITGSPARGARPVLRVVSLRRGYWNPLSAQRWKTTQNQIQP